MLEKDYQSYEIDYMKPYEIERRNIRVILPYVIYGNIVEIFTMFLDIESQNLNMINLLKFMLFARLFQIKFKVSDYQMFDFRSMLSDLKEHPIWKTE